MTPSQPLSNDPRFEKLRAGEPLSFPAPPKDREETPKEKADRTIPAHWLELLAEGCKRTISVSVQISNAIVEGPLDLQYALFERSLFVTNSKFRDTVDFSFATFQHAASFDGSRFLKPAYFRAAHAQYDFSISGTYFAEAARFQDVQVTEMFAASGADFAEADFQRIEVGKDLFFAVGAQGGPASFRGRALFSSARVVGDANFSGVKFEGPARFQSFNVEGDAFFSTDECGRRAIFGDTVHFNSAQITGNTDFRGAEFRSDAWFDAVRLGGPAFFRPDRWGQPVTFAKRASFPSAEFTLDALFNQATFQGPVDFDSTYFKGAAKFHSADFAAGSKASFEGTRFEHGACFDCSQFRGETVFDNSYFNNNALFDCAVFGDKVQFYGMRTAGDASFVGAQFVKAAFNGIQIGGDALFHSDNSGQRVIFVDAAFGGARIAGNADFKGAKFKAKGVFDGLEVGHDAYFNKDDRGHRVMFGGEASFRGARIAGDASFVGAGFTADAAFAGLQVGGDALFCDQVKFRRDADFNNAHFQGQADFNFSKFASNAKATFVGAKFERAAFFNSARFQGKTDFTSTIAERDIRFSCAQLSGPVSFREAHMSSVFFLSDISEPREHRWFLLRRNETRPEGATNWHGPVDLRGFTYERIYVYLPDLLDRLKPFDRQPYSQLETALRKVGDDERARKVYLERRRVEREEKRHTARYTAWLVDWIYNIVANYGVLPLRLVGFASVFILFGAFLFMQPGALEPAKKDRGQPAVQCYPTPFEAGLAVSIHYFLPMDVPVGADCDPGTARVSLQTHLGRWNRKFTSWLSPSWYATIFLRVAGTILMGVGLAAVTGLLRRIAQ